MSEIAAHEPDAAEFRPDDPQPNLLRIPVRAPFEVSAINVYLSADPVLTLIDTGPLTDDALDDLRAGVAAAGYSLSDVRRVIITHGHVDHWGLAARVREESGAEIWAHRQSVAWMSDFPAEWQRRTAYLSLLCAELGVPAGEMPAVNRGMKALGAYADPVAPTRLLDDGDTVELAGARWNVVYTPGHAINHICLHEPTSRALISGDHLLPDISSNPVLEAPTLGESARPRMLPLYIASLHRTAALPVLWIYPGHGLPFTGHRKLIKRRLELHEQRAAKVLGFLADGPATTYELSKRLFPNLEGVQLFLGISETLGHLDLLEDRGQVATQRSGRLLQYTAK